MRFIDFIIFSYKGLSQRKSRFLLTIIMIIVATSLSVSIKGLTQGFSSLIDDRIKSIYPSSISPKLNDTDHIMLNMCNSEINKNNTIIRKELTEKITGLLINSKNLNKNTSDNICLVYSGKEKDILVEIDRSVFYEISRKEPLFYILPFEQYLIYFGYIKLDRISEAINDLTNGFSIFISGVASISLAVASIGIAITLLNSINERKDEIGIIKSLGATANTIILIFIFEAIIVGIIGSSIGVMVGVISGELIIYTYKIQQNSLSALSPIFTFEDVIFSWTVSVLLCFLSSIFPSLKASHMPPLSLKK